MFQWHSSAKALAWTLLICTGLGILIGLIDSFNFRRGEGPIVLAAFFNGIESHSINIIQNFVTITGSKIHHGIIHGNRIINGLPEMPYLRQNWVWSITIWQ